MKKSALEEIAKDGHIKNRDQRCKFVFFDGKKNSFSSIGVE
jgi:hypothetical protein